MAPPTQAHDGARIRVEGIGGIEESEVSLRPGTTVLEGRNATNRTSLLQAIRAVCGSDSVSIKGDRSSATVEMTLDGTTYSRALKRTETGVASEGNPYLDDPTTADLFAFLLGSNEARRAVIRDGGYRDVIMRPVDTDEIETEIERRLSARRSLDEEIEELESLGDRLPELEERRTGLEEAIEEKSDSLEETEAEIEALDRSIEESQESQSAFEDRLADLKQKRSELERTRYDLETERESLAAFRAERSELEDELPSLETASDGQVEELEARMERLRSQKRARQAELNELQTVIGFNEEMIQSAGDETFLPDDEGATSDQPVTDQLLEGDELTCWTCGSTVDSDQLETMLETLRSRSSEKFEAVAELEDRLDELAAERDDLEAGRRRRDQIETRLEALSTRIDDREEAIEALESDRNDLEAAVEEIEAELEDLETEANDDVVDLHKQANTLEYEIDRLENELAEVEAEIETVEDELDRLEELRNEREVLQEEIGDLRTRIERLERQAIEAFNEHMETVLELLDYRNLERIWFERNDSNDRGTGPNVSAGIFELHVVRSTESGTTYEDTVGHLSESEREVTGLVFALAGYLVHEVYDEVPFMLLDSLESIDSQRIAKLVQYFTDYTRYLVVALLPEDAAALDGDHHVVAEI